MSQATQELNGEQCRESVEESISTERSRLVGEAIISELRQRQQPQTVAPTTPQPLRLNIGASNIHLSGFTAIDRKNGTEAYPLACADNSVEEILASHVLEHFGHREVAHVLNDWIAKLKPGGKIRIAVPDFEKIAKYYLEGAPVNPLGYVMGGHLDENDKHGCIFDRESLMELMICAGLERIGPWVSDVPGCSQDELSLNLQGFKPTGPQTKVKGIRACMSVPRFGPLMHPRCAEKAFRQLGIQGESGSSCFWHQKLSCLMEDAIADPDCQYVLTMDFDTIFSAADVVELYRLMEACPEADAVFPLQAKRGCHEALFSLPGKTPGKVRVNLDSRDLERNLLPAYSGHFGLTLIRASTLRKFPRPWMVPCPNSEGQWNKNQTDADIDFWRRFQLEGFKAFLAPKVVVGHLEEVVKWPGKDLRPIYQTTSNYDEIGIPADVQR